MKIAIPLENRRLSGHFGHCEEFAFFTVNKETKEITEKEFIQAPPHKPGFIPKWLNDRGISVIIAGNMGERARTIFQQKNVETVLGAPTDTAENLVNAWLNDTIVSSGETCRHDHHQHQHGHDHHDHHHNHKHGYNQ